MARRLWWALIAALLMGGTPLLAAGPQDLGPCKPIVPGGRCVTPLPQPWASVDFGAPKIAPDPGTTSWQQRVAVPYRPIAGHHGIDRVWAPTMEIAGVPPIPPIDCAMVKHGDSKLDPRLIQPEPRTRITHSGVIIPVAPCKGK